MGVKRNYFTIFVYLIVCFFIGKSTHKIYNSVSTIIEVKRLFTIINSTSDYPTGDNIETIENVKNDIIYQIQKSNLYNNIGKEYILDSIKSIKFKIFDPTGRRILKKTTAAMFVKVGMIDDELSDNFFLKGLNSPIKNIILINKNYLSDEELPEILTHEIYHYVDFLYGGDDELSDKLDLSNFVDKNISNKKYLFNKTERIFNLSGLDDDIKNQANDFSKDALKNVDYLTSNNEIFVRWKTFKSKLVKLGYIEDVKSVVNRETIDKYNKYNSISLTDLDILLILDWDKIYELDMILN